MFVKLCVFIAGAKWKPLRKLLNPIFNLRTLQSFIPIFNEKTEIFVKDLMNEVGKPAFNILPHAADCTLDGICCEYWIKFALILPLISLKLLISLCPIESISYCNGAWYRFEIGARKRVYSRPSTVNIWVFAKVSFLKKTSFTFLSSIRIFEVIGKRFTKLWLYNDFAYRLTNLYKEQQKYMINIRNLTNLVRLFCFFIVYCINGKFDQRIKCNRLTVQVFNEKTKPYKSNGHSFDDVHHISTGPQLPIIPLFIEGKLNEEMVKSQIEILLLAGFDTTSTTLSYVTLMLAIHPHIQDQVFDELHSIYQTQDEETTYEHILKMNVLDRVIKETMRLFPGNWIRFT